MKRKYLHEDEDGEGEAGCPNEPGLFDTPLRSRDCRPAFSPEDYTVAWVCALPLELTAARAVLEEEHSLPAGWNQSHHDDNVYVLGSIAHHKVVMACLPQYGTNNAAIVATNLKRSFPNVGVTLMVGIGGGCPSQADLYLGDIVVGTRVMQYDMGKVVAGGRFEETAVPKTPGQLLDAAVVSLRSTNGSALRVPFRNLSRPRLPDRLFRSSYQHLPSAPTCDSCDPDELLPRPARSSDEPKIHWGVIASGNRVMKDAAARDDIANRLKALCFEMEAAGIMDNTQCLPIRGICDYSDSHKNKDWQKYAAATAAAYAKELLEVLPSRETPGRPAATFSQRSESNDRKALERRKRLLESLDFPQMDARKTTIRAAHARTCHWFVDRGSKYRAWLDPTTRSRTHGFLWMQGKAGVGKSTIMKFAYLKSRKSDGPNAFSASFFFNARGHDLEKSTAGMYRSLLRQLMHKFPDLQSILDDTEIVPPNQQGCPDLSALQGLLSGAVMALAQRSVTCFIDALDECDEQDVRDMVDFFQDLAEATTDAEIGLRICFSSRPYPYIRIRHGIRLTLEDEHGHSEDLAQYVKGKLTIDDPSLLADLQSQILAKASGIFLWVVMVVDILNRENDDGGLSLKTKLSQIPDKLSDLFKGTLMRDQKNPERLQLCILWILCAQRPLTLEEFRHALWVALLDWQESNPIDSPVDLEPPDTNRMDECVRLVISSSKGLAEITKSKRPTVQFVHESVRDFLVKEKGLQTLWPGIGFDWEAESHERFKRCCSRYLSLRGVQAIIIDWPWESDRAQKYPFLEYASQQILYHANAAAPVVPQDNFLSEFLGPAGISVVNLFEQSPIGRYGVNATTPLYVVADRGLGNLVRTRMKQESAAYSPGGWYQHPFFAAWANGHEDAVAALLGPSSTACDDVNIAECLRGMRRLEDYQGRTPLSWAAQQRQTFGIVKALVKSGADVNENDQTGRTPLLRASEEGNETAAQFLIKNGANVNALAKVGSTALIKAAERGHEGIVRLLIDNKADVNARAQDGSTALMEAGGRGYERIVRLLIENKADVNSQAEDGSTVLIRALADEYTAVIRLLLEHGANVNCRDNTGWTALMLALEINSTELVKILIWRGADIKAQAEDGTTVLMVACAARARSSVANMRLLLENGADPNTRAKDGSTAMTVATEWNARQLLVDYNANVDSPETQQSLDRAANADVGSEQKESSQLRRARQI